LKDGIILFAHGSREPEWAQPLESIAQELAGQFIVELAYLERMKPTLDEAVNSVVARGARRVRIVPVFLGIGGHIKQDLPKLVEAARARHAAVEIVLEQTIGERKEITDAIAAVISKGISHQPR
jgi:sirohydrochlorin cobaltochelatase